jgi:hypothetical protein
MKNHGWEHCFLIYYERKILFITCKNTAYKISEQGLRFKGLANMHVRHARVYKNYFKAIEMLFELLTYNKGKWQVFI